MLREGHKGWVVNSETMGQQGYKRWKTGMNGGIMSTTHAYGPWEVSKTKIGGTWVNIWRAVVVGYEISILSCGGE